MPISASTGSAQIIKTGCRYVCEGSREPTTVPTTEDWAQHPGLNLAMDGIAMYATWVSRTVMPIVFQWVDEHKPEMREKMGVDPTAPLPDDVEAVVQAAFEIIKGRDAYIRGKAAFEEYQTAMATRSWDPTGINPHWTRVSRMMREQVREALHEASRPLTGVTS